MLKFIGYVMLFVLLIVFVVIFVMIFECGLSVLISVGIFMGEFYLILGLLWFILIGCLIFLIGCCMFWLIKGISELVLLVFIILSFEVVFFGILEKLEEFGVFNKIVSFVFFIGYLFNLVGLMVYCLFVVIFIV